MLTIACNHNSFHIKDELLSRKKREKKKKTGGKGVDLSKLGTSEKNERWEHIKIFHILKLLKSFFNVIQFHIHFRYANIYICNDRDKRLIMCLIS